GCDVVRVVERAIDVLDRHHVVAARAPLTPELYWRRLAVAYKILVAQIGQRAGSSRSDIDRTRAHRRNFVVRNDLQLITRIDRRGIAHSEQLVEQIFGSALRILT